MHHRLNPYEHVNMKFVSIKVTHNATLGFFCKVTENCNMHTQWAMWITWFGFRIFVTWPPGGACDSPRLVGVSPREQHSHQLHRLTQSHCRSTRRKFAAEVRKSSGNEVRVAQKTPPEWKLCVRFCLRWQHYRAGIPAMVVSREVSERWHWN